MRCVIYVRKSNEQEATGDDKSVATQERACREYVARQGWTIVRVVSEDAVSGALMTRAGRPELFALIDEVKSRSRTFDAVLVTHEDRLGRDTALMPILVGKLVSNGVKLFSVATGERKLDTATDKFLLSAVAFAADVEREGASRRVREKHRDSIGRGHWTGGKVPLGYRKVRENGHAALEMDQVTSKLVQRIFTPSKDGHGTRAIAAILNTDATTRTVRKWSGAGIRDTLTNKIYIGQIAFGLTRDVKDGEGLLIRVKSSEPPVIVERPDLRIIDDALWEAVAERKAATAALRDPRGRLQGKPEQRALGSLHLLSGFLACHACGGSLVVQTLVPSGVRRKTYRYYKCALNMNRGKVCSNNRGLPLEAAHEAISAHLRREACTPARLGRVLDELAAEQTARPGERDAERKALTAALAAVDGKLSRLIAAIEEGGELRALTARMKELERERAAITAQMEHVDGLTRAAALEGQARLQAEEVLAGWAEALAAGPVVARQALRKILRGPIVVRPEEDGWSYEAPCGLGAVLGGAIGREPETWKVTVGPAPEADLDGEVRALLSRRSVSPSSRSWR